MLFSFRFRFLDGIIGVVFKSVMYPGYGAKISRLQNTCAMHVLGFCDHQISCLAIFVIVPPAMYMCHHMGPDSYQITALIMLPVVLFEAAKRPRSGCQYSVQERAVISCFKTEYRAAQNKDERKQIFRSNILPAIFNYWTDNGKISVSYEIKKERIAASISFGLSVISCSLFNSKWGNGLLTIGGRFQQKKQ